ncbi:MAG: HU family DNA-binding protein [Paludibacteraceae bacterium]|jgi:DNA-binding protein HU-beta|nr:HU family DNA-binding protein [Paludibacteraceae bacterium]MBR4704523.1 HU family DNA-binding protein [Paludibacteraceae bacterium]
MNKSELIKAAAAKAEVSAALAGKVLDAALEAAVEAVKKGEGVQLIGFASISVAQKAARKAKNPRTGAVINVPARKVVKIKPGAKFAL